MVATTRRSASAATHQQQKQDINSKTKKMRKRIRSASSNKRGAEKGEHGNDSGRAKKKRQVGDRVYNNKINPTIKNFHFEKKGLIFDALKTGSGPKMGQSHLCGKFHVHGWCTNECERKSMHRTLPPNLEKKFNKFCQEAATP